MFDGRSTRITTSQGARAEQASTFGTIVELAFDGAPYVDFEGNTGGPLRARVVGRVEPQSLSMCLKNRAPVFLGFEDGDGRKPVILSLAPAPAAAQTTEIDGHKALVLACGDARIALRADGKVTIHGRTVETRARGANRVRGAVVEIN